MNSEDLALVEMRSYFVRGRNCLLVRGKLTDLYMDYYLHLMQHSMKHEKEFDLMLKEALAAMVLHLASRPHDERCAWTIHLQQPLLNLFVTGGGHPHGQVTGRIFYDDVKEMPQSLIIAQTTRPNMQPRQSMITFEGADMLHAVETFYSQSEQRPTRLFRLEEEDFVQISAEPDADLDWLANLQHDEITTLDQREQLSLLEKRYYHFDCGCTVDRMFPMLSRLTPDDLAYIFEDGQATLTCPRCGARYNAPKALFEAWLADQQA